MVSQEEYDQLVGRIVRLEQAVNSLFTAINQCVTNRQVNELTTSLQEDVVILEERLNEALSRIQSIEEEP